MSSVAFNRNSQGERPPLARVAADAVADSGSGGRSFQRGVIIYLAVAFLLLVPGVYFRLLDPPANFFADIRFGSGVRFWLGVAGTAAMVSLLLYPLRKLLSRNGWAGRVATWFHVHMIAGILAPVAIAYHANFGFGGTNANVALVSMIVVVLSGLAGIYAYGGASRRFHGTERTARQHRDYILSHITAANGSEEDVAALSLSFDTFEAACMQPHGGVAASLARRRRIESAGRVLWRDVLAAISRTPDAKGHEITAAAANYLRLARRASSRAVAERAWGWWRRFHLPVYLIMLAATALHVEAVWNMDDGLSAAAPEVMTAPDVAGADAVAKPATPAPELVRPPVAVSRSDVASSGREVPGAAQRTAVEKPVEAVPAAAAPQLKAPPKTVARRTVVNPPVADARKATNPPIGEVYAELERRPVAPPMGLGRRLPGTLQEQFAAFKEKRAAGTFRHDDGETGFQLSGKHLKVECSSCHTRPLTGERSSSPRACIDCHRKDDVHKGRRPDCANCHTANRWSQIIRRR